MATPAWNGNMAYIRMYYGVPAKRGGRVIVNGWPGTITGSDGAYIKVRLDNADRSRLFHPTWKVEYINNTPLTPNAFRDTLESEPGAAGDV